MPVSDQGPFGRKCLQLLFKSLSINISFVFQLYRKRIVVTLDMERLYGEEKDRSI